MLHKNHSTETALAKIINITLPWIKKKITALTLLDFSSTNSTISHTILIEQLSRYFDNNSTKLN